MINETDKYGRPHNYVRGHSNRNKKFSEEHREKISNSHKGKKKPWAIKNLGKHTKKGCTPHNKGVPCSEEQKIKISMTKTGVRNFNDFKTNEVRRIRHSIEYKQWRNNVFNRDNYTCKECGKRGCYLEAHHIKPFSTHKDLRFDVDNGITYCVECHIINDDSRACFNI